MERDDACERMVLVRSTAIPDSEMMAVYESSQRWHYFHERYAFAACISGAAGVLYRGAHSDLVGQCTMLLEPGETQHDTYVARPNTYRVLFVEPRTLAECARELGALPAMHYSQPFTNDPGLFRALNGLCLSIEERGSPLEQQSLFAHCVASIAGHAEHKGAIPEVRNGKQALERARAHLRERYDESVSLDELVHVSRLSRFHLVHSFTRQFGIAPHAYQISVRVERARALLLKGVSPSQAGTSVGFADQSHFTRHFKRVMRVTPSAYARLGTSKPITS